MKFSQKICILFFIFFFANVAIFAENEQQSSLPWKTLILPSILALSAMGLFSGIGLGIASKVFEVYVDPKTLAINDVLPKANCGACGYAGCAAYSEAVAKGTAAGNLCLPGGNAVSQKIGEIMGVKVSDVVAPVATILCTRKKDVKKNQEYKGIRDCRAAATLGSNIYECAYACLGMGTCSTVCPFGAIVMNEEDMPVVLEDHCTGCGICVENCPVKIIRLTPRDHHVHILCASTELPKIKAKVHKKGACIACRKCVKQCPVQAISIVNNVAVIDYTKCTNCEQCIAVCPTTAIFNIRPNKKEIK